LQSDEKVEMVEIFFYIFYFMIFCVILHNSS